MPIQASIVSQTKENRLKPQITHIFVGVQNKIFCRRQQKVLWKNYDINSNGVIAEPTQITLTVKRFNYRTFSKKTMLLNYFH